MGRRRLTISAILLSALWFCFPSRGQAPAAASRTVNTPTVLDDDATLLDPGSYTFDYYNSYSRSPQDYYASIPGLDFTLGLNPRLEFSASSGYRSANSENNGLDDSLVGMKVLLLSQNSQRPAIAVKPTLEVLSEISGNEQANSYRADFGLPILVEKDFESWSASYTAGYLTRGVAFTVLKVEGNWWDCLTPAAIFSFSQMTTDLAALQSLGLNRRQIDTQANLTREINSRWSVFVQAGRSIGRSDLNNYSFEFTAGVTFAAQLWGRSNGPEYPGPTIHF